MKKTLIALLILCITLPVACAEAPAFGDYSDDEIVKLLKQVQDEIVARNIEKTARLTAGTYVGGRDIPVGSYILTSAENEGDFGIVSLRSANDSENEYPSKLYTFQKEPTEYSVFVVIEEGDTLVTPYAYDLTISTGIIFQ